MSTEMFTFSGSQFRPYTWPPVTLWCETFLNITLWSDLEAWRVKLDRVNKQMKKISRFWELRVSEWNWYKDGKLLYVFYYLWSLQRVKCVKNARFGGLYSVSMWTDTSFDLPWLLTFTSWPKWSRHWQVPTSVTFVPSLTEHFERMPEKTVCPKRGILLTFVSLFWPLTSPVGRFHTHGKASLTYFGFEVKNIVEETWIL